MRITEMISLVADLLGIIASLGLIWVIKDYFLERIIRYKLRRMLRFGNMDVDIMVPTRSSESGDSKTSLISSDFVTFDETVAISHVTTLVSKVNKNAKVNIVRANRDERHGNNTVCIGGPMANEFSGWIFEHYFSDLLIGCPKGRYITDDNKDTIGKYVYEDEVDEISTLKYKNEIIYEFRNDDRQCGYICILWINAQKTFSNKKAGNWLVLFGNSSVTSLRSCSVLADHTGRIYKHIKKYLCRDKFGIIIPYENGLCDFSKIRDIMDPS